MTEGLGHMLLQTTMHFQLYFYQKKKQNKVLSFYILKTVFLKALNLGDISSKSSPW